MALITFIFVMDGSYNAVFGILFSLVHEFGHIAVIMVKKVKIKEISFGMINIDILNEDLETKDVDKLLVFLAGPCLNLLLSLVFTSIYIIGKIYVFKVMTIQNFVLGIINLLPIKSLDGGKILYIILSQKMEIYKAEKILKLVSIIFLIPICILGVVLLIKSKYNFSLLILSCYLISYILFK